MIAGINPKLSLNVHPLSLWEVFDVGLCRATEIDDTPTKERNVVPCAARALNLLAKGNVAVVGRVRLGPSHQPRDLGGIKGDGVPSQIFEMVADMAIAGRSYPTSAVNCRKAEWPDVWN